MKDVSEIVCCVVDYGTFTDLAVTLSRTFAKQYYHTPVQEEYLDVKKCCLAKGVAGIERVDDFMHPDIVDEVDLWVFPDIGFGGHQQYLRAIGKPVWGSMGLHSMELYRTKFMEFLDSVDLPVVPTVTITGLENLAEHLKSVTNKWIKVNRYRANMETWKHINYAHSIPKLNCLACEFGGMASQITFVIQDEIETSVEIGYDGWTVRGQFPKSSFQGYEKKNELYLGSLLDYHELPEAIRAVNEAMGPLLSQWGYANFIATEIRWVSEDEFYFIDPTMRMPGQTGEQLLETCSNLADVIWKGANGELIDPTWHAPYAAEATVHYTEKDDGWKTIHVPEEIEQWFKPGHYCVVDGMLQFPPGKNDEIGVIMGIGETIEESIDALKEHFSKFDGEPVCMRDDLFVDLLKSINDAENEGLEFSDQEIPKPESVNV